MNQYYLINMIAIKRYLSDFDKRDSERTLCGLDFLVENIENNLLEILNGTDKLMIEINHIQKEVSLLGDSLPSQKWKIIFEKRKSNESIYNTFMDAINYVKNKEGREECIKEIKYS